MRNPYSISFGLMPSQYIPRLEQREQVIGDFNQDPPPTQAYVIIGVRGSGKTVLLSEISEHIGRDWIIVDLSSEDDMLQSLTAQLYGERSVHKLFVKANFDFSFMGIGVHTEGNAPAYDSQTAISMMLEEIRKSGRKVLVTVDEVDNSPEMRRFASTFQILIRKGLPIYLLMAGIPEQVYGLMSEKKSTFLMRTPRIMMTPLNHMMMKRSYMRNLDVSEECADELARMTGGYSFAYQVLGYICWGKQIDPKAESFADILEEYDYYLQEFSYNKIWEKMSPADKQVAKAIAKYDDFTKVRNVVEDLDTYSRKFSVYRDRLKKKGVLDTSRYGEVAFILPRFAEFVRETV